MCSMLCLGKAVQALIARLRAWMVEEMHSNLQVVTFDVTDLDLCGV